MRHCQSKFFIISTTVVIQCQKSSLNLSFMIVSDSSDDILHNSLKLESTYFCIEVVISFRSLHNANIKKKKSSTRFYITPRLSPILYFSCFYLHSQISSHKKVLNVSKVIFNEQSKYLLSYILLGIRDWVMKHVIIRCLYYKIFPHPNISHSKQCVNEVKMSMKKSMKNLSAHSKEPKKKDK